MMISRLLLIHLLLLGSATFVHSRFQLHPQRRYPSSTRSQYSFETPFPHRTDDDSLRGSLSAARLAVKNPANEEQIEKFTKLLIDRLNLKEPPNVTLNVNDGTGLPSIVKTLEKEHIQQHEELRHPQQQQQQKSPEESQATTERAILPGGSLPQYTCQRQIAAKVNINRNDLQQIECFRFTKSSTESKSLPTNQVIKELRLYVKKNYFSLSSEQEKLLSPEMFQIYQVFRPTSNDTSANPLSGLTDTIRLPISQIKQLNRNWFEFTIDSQRAPVSIQQIYQQFLMPWYGLGISHAVQSAWPTFYHRYHSKKSFENFLRSNDEEEYESKESHHQLPYMLVEYGEKILTPSKARGQRHVQAARARPARPCDPKSPCCRRPLTIDLDQGSNALNFVIYPRQIDIGECIGLCGTSGSSLSYPEVKNDQHQNKPNSGHNMMILHYNGLLHNRTATGTQVNRSNQQSAHCCSYSRTGGLELMYTTTNGGPIIRKYIPNMVVEECRCGLPATIQQV